MSSTTTGTTTGEPATDETSQLIASDKVEGTAVYNRAGDRLGSVYNFMVNKRSGQVAYAVLSFGGFLGIGTSYHPLPWNELTYDTSLGGYVVNRSREQLKAHPPIRTRSCGHGTMQFIAAALMIIIADWAEVGWRSRKA